MLRCVSACNRHDLSINRIESELFAASICRLMLSSVYVHTYSDYRGNYPSHHETIIHMSMHLVTLFTHPCN